MKPLLLMGDEAVAQAAIDAGIRAAWAYPGTPSTEIFEHVERAKPKDRELFTQWSANEKTAYESALGTSYAGHRAIVSMKHVGLNVAADAFMNSAITGANGGLVVIVADDPGMHSSQNEQDSRYYSDFGRVPCLEPSTQQEAYDMTYRALALSEEIGLPVMIRMVTRLAHSRAPVIPSQRLDQPSKPLVSDKRRYTLLPVNARRHWRALIDRWSEVEQAVWDTGLNVLRLEGERLGIIASGVGYNYVMENLGQGEGLSVLKVGTYPVPLPLIQQLFDHCDEILVVEDGYPFMESNLKGWLDTAPRPVHGRLDGTLPRTGELNPTVLRQAMGLETLPTASGRIDGLAGRPPALCQGCPHQESYLIINEIMGRYEGQGRVLSDIGCYTLGALPPYEAIDSCVDMGASITMALGAATSGVSPSFAVIGDSTFAHSGLTGLLDAVRANANMVVVIVDNAIVAMTGRQETALTGDRLRNAIIGLGVPEEHVRTVHVKPRKVDELRQAFEEEVAYEGLSVIIPTRPCIQIRKKK